MDLILLIVYLTTLSTAHTAQRWVIGRDWWKFNCEGRRSCRGDVIRSTVLIIHNEKNPTRCNNVLKFYYSIFIWSSKYFGRHTAHNQEPKTVLAASGFSYVKGFWTCRWWTLSGSAWQLTYFLTYLLTPWSRVLLEKLTSKLCS
jgi:hypothetical protein